MFFVGDHWAIVGDWERDDVDTEGRMALVVCPSTVPGNGWEPDTQEFLNLLAKMDLRGKVVADVGAGAGLLAIAAAKLGAETVYAMEINPDAIYAARRNVAANRTPQVKVINGTLPRQRVDILIANIGDDELEESLRGKAPATLLGKDVLPRGDSDNPVGP